MVTKIVYFNKRMEIINMVTVVFTEKNFDAGLIPDTGTLYIIAASDTMVPIQFVEKVSAASITGLRIMPIKYISGKCSEVGVAFKLGELASSVDEDIEIVGPKQLFVDIAKEGFVGSDGKHHSFTIRTTQKKVSEKEPVRRVKKEKKIEAAKIVEEEPELFPTNEFTHHAVNNELEKYLPINPPEKPVIDSPVSVKHERKPRTVKEKLPVSQGETNVSDNAGFNIEDEVDISPEIRNILTECNVTDEEEILAVCSAIKQSTDFVSLSMCLRMKLSLIGRKEVKDDADRLSDATASRYADLKTLL